MIENFEKYESYLRLILGTDNEDIKKLFQDYTETDIISSLFVVVRLTKGSTNYKLTSLGHHVLTTLMPYYTIDLKQNDILNFKGKILVKFDRIMTVPWIIQASKLYIFDEEIAFNFAMAETFEQFISLYD